MKGIAVKSNSYAATNEHANGNVGFGKMEHPTKLRLITGRPWQLWYGLSLQAHTYSMPFALYFLMS